MRPSVRASLLAVASTAAAVTLGFGSVVALHGHSAQAQAAITVSIQAPANGSTVSNPVKMGVSSTGVTIKAATEQDPNAGHYHYFIDRDPATVVRQGQQIPTDQPDIIHSADPNLVLPNLAPGPHTVWVVLAHTDHTPYNPNVQAQVTFTVSAAGAAGAAASPAATAPRTLPSNGDNPTTPLLIALGMAAVLLAGGYGAAKLAASRK